jgi:hypothetical protein
MTEMTSPASHVRHHRPRSLSAFTPKNDFRSTSPLRVRIQLSSSQTSDVGNRTTVVVRSVINKNDLYLHYLLARRYERKNNPRAVFWYQKAADQGYTKAQYCLGRCYAHGFGVEQDKTQTVIWCQKAADQGYTEAQYSLGRCYANGFGVEQDKAQAVIWYQKAADQGHQLAQNEIREAEH